MPHVAESLGLYIIYVWQRVGSISIQSPPFTCGEKCVDERSVAPVPMRPLSMLMPREAPNM